MKMLETSVPSVLRAGDLRVSFITRIASAAGEDAVAISQLHQALADGI